MLNYGTKVQLSLNNISVQSFSRTPSIQVQSTNLSNIQTGLKRIITLSEVVKTSNYFQTFEWVLFIFFIIFYTKYNRWNFRRKQEPNNTHKSFRHKVKILKRKTTLTWVQTATTSSRSSPNSSTSSESFWKSSTLNFWLSCNIPQIMESVNSMRFQHGQIYTEKCMYSRILQIRELGQGTRTSGWVNV